MKRDKHIISSKNKLYIIIVIVALFCLLIIPYVNVLVLTEMHGEEFFNITYPLDNAGVYDCKVYSYKKNDEAKVLLVFGDNEFATMQYYTWNDELQLWKASQPDYVLGKYEKVLWNENGGQEFYWPFFYVKEFFGRMNNK